MRTMIRNKKKFIVRGTKILFYRGEEIEASTEEQARIFYNAAINSGHVAIDEVDLDTTVDEVDEE